MDGGRWRCRTLMRVTIALIVNGFLVAGNIVPKFGILQSGQVDAISALLYTFCRRHLSKISIGARYLKPIVLSIEKGDGKSY